MPGGLLISVRLATAKGKNYKKDDKSPEVSADPDLLEEYDFRGGRRGVYAERYAQGTNLVALDPDLIEVFPNSEAVNEALRTLVRAARRSVKPAPGRKREAA